GEIDQAFQHRFLAANRGPGGGRLISIFNYMLALAIVAKTGRLEHTRGAQPGDGAVQGGQLGHMLERCRGETGGGEEILLPAAMLGHVQHAAVGAHQCMLGRGGGRGERHVLELEGDYIHGGCEIGDRGGVLIIGDHYPISDLAGWRIRARRQRVHAIVHAPRRQRQHAPQLAAAEDADAGARQDRATHGSCSLCTLSACAARKSARRRRRLGRVTASCATANKAALRAPESPMAKVAVGTPLGICTIDNSESSPCSARLCTGTPSTGSNVWAATMPGKWAAPPAPAMITSRPRSAAVVA